MVTSQRICVISYYLISGFSLSMRAQNIITGKSRGTAWDVETSDERASSEPGPLIWTYHRASPSAHLGYIHDTSGWRPLVTLPDGREPDRGPWQHISPSLPFWLPLCIPKGIGSCQDFGERGQASSDSLLAPIV